MQEQPARKLRLVPTSVGERRQTDAEMVVALQRKERGAAEAIWNRHSERVRRFLCRALGSPDDEVEDLTQEVFIRVFARARAIREPSALRGFIMSVAFWVLKWELRRRWVRRVVRLSKSGDLPEIGVQGGADQEARHALRSCYAILDRLSVQERTAFVLRYLEEMTNEEVADRLECSVSTAKRVITRAAARVSAQVGKNADLRSYFLDAGNAGDAGNDGDTGDTGFEGLPVNRRNATEDGLDPLAKGLVAVVGDHLDSPAEAEGGGPRSFAPLAARMERRRLQLRTTRSAFAGASCLLVAFAVWLAPRLGERPHAALTYTLNGEPPPHGGYIAPSAGKPVLSFSDGTRVALEPTARGRVVEIGRHGARIALDEGKAHVEVAHLPGADWRFEAGPFVINVHGTKFSFGWSARQARLDVQMASGIVSVSGPLSGGEIFLRAGQTLSVSLNDEGAPAVSATVGQIGSGVGAASTSPPPVPAVPPAPAIAPPPAADRGPSDSPARPTARSDSTEGWAAKLAAGKAAAVVADAERRGLAKVLDSSSSEDLAALADAARFEKNDTLARRALLAQRRRFSRSVRAREASFLLGRLDDAIDDGAESALGWYDQYLGEAPGGAYVSEALGRKMMDLERTHRHLEAAAVAADYLRRFPSGIYVHAAQALVRAP